MPVPELAVDTASIVIKGNLNPSKFSVQELQNQGLVSPDDTSKAVQKFSTPDISILETKGMRLLGNRELLQLTAQQADQFKLLRDLAVNILRLFKEEPVSVMGINRDVHFSIGTANAWHKIGDTLVPKEVWTGVLDYVGMASTTVQAARPDRYRGYRQVTVQPSNAVPQGVYVSHNDHYMLELTDEAPSSREQLHTLLHEQATADVKKVGIAIKILNEEWDKSMTRASAVIERVASEAE